MISPETLRRFDLFAGIDVTFLKDVAMLGEEETFEEGEWLFHEGFGADSFYLLLEGTVELTIDLDARGMHRSDLTTIVAGQVIGWSALVEPHVYTLGGTATSRVKVARLDGRRLRALMDANAELGYRLMTRLAIVLGERLTNIRVQLVSLIPDTA